MPMVGGWLLFIISNAICGRTLILWNHTMLETYLYGSSKLSILYSLEMKAAIVEL